MKYHGKLFGKLWNKFIELKPTTDDFDSTGFELSGNSGEQPKRCFVNVYEDKGGTLYTSGRFISDEDYGSYEEAFEQRDKEFDNYIETVEIIRKP